MQPDPRANDLHTSKHVQEHIAYFPPQPSVETIVADRADAMLTNVVLFLRLKTAFHWLLPKTFHARAVYQWQAPMSHQLPGRNGEYSRGVFKHLDVFHRRFQGIAEEQFLNPLDGRVRRLVVQTIGPIYDTANDTTWRRTYIRNISPMIIRLAWYPYAGLPSEDTTLNESQRLKDKLLPSNVTWTSQQWTSLCSKWIPTCIGLLVLVGRRVVLLLTADSVLDDLPY